MAVKRTKKQKQQAQARRAEKFTYQYTSDIDLNSKTTAKKKPDSITDKQVKQLMISSPKDIFRDLLKTVVVTVIVTLSLVAIYFLKR